MSASPNRSKLDAAAALAGRDPAMRELLRAFGPIRLTPRRGTTTFGALSRMIIGQQLSSKAASTIFERYQALFPDRDFHDFGSLLSVQDAMLRQAGLSTAKTRYIRHLAEAAHRQQLPHVRQLRQMGEAEVREILLQFPGVGTWTVSMFEIFILGKPDVLALQDVGLQRGFEMVYRRPAMGKNGLAASAKVWSPFCSTASLYLWKAADNPDKLPVVSGPPIPSRVRAKQGTP